MLLLIPETCCWVCTPEQKLLAEDQTMNDSIKQPAGIVKFTAEAYDASHSTVCKQMKWPVCSTQIFRSSWN
jgi:hypothetical protein